MATPTSTSTPTATASRTPVRASAPIPAPAPVPALAIESVAKAFGRQPVLEFHKYYCPVRKFNSLEELAALIHRAADESKAYFAGENATK